jgi:hypothetical protein
MRARKGEGIASGPLPGVLKACGPAARWGERCDRCELPGDGDGDGDARRAPFPLPHLLPMAPCSGGGRPYALLLRPPRPRAAARPALPRGALRREAQGGGRGEGAARSA